MQWDEKQNEGWTSPTHMRFVLYNIRYATGTGWHFHLPFPFSGYLRDSERNLHRISAFLRELSPDIIGLVEVDNGSFRSKRCNQAEIIARDLGYEHVYESKYGQASFAQAVPVLKEQGNAFITNQSIHAKSFHYFEKGIKRLIIELELENCVIFLVHLSLMYRHRQYQLSDLYALFHRVDKPMIVAGDFNAFFGDRELNLFMAAAGLQNANTTGTPTYPSNKPRRQLDFILHSPEITIEHFEVPQSPYSDHLPVLCDFYVSGK